MKMHRGVRDPLCEKALLVLGSEDKQVEKFPGTRNQSSPRATFAATVLPALLGF
jgi:hypothetical protein